MKYTILEEKIVYNDFFRIKKARLRHELFDGKGEIEIERQCFERGDSVAVLIHETDTDCLLFTRQFRYPVADKAYPWILEIPAGSVEKDEQPEDCARREVEEEIGYAVGDLEYIAAFFVSPGGCSERIYLYYSEVTSDKKIAAGGGVAGEHENIHLEKIPLVQVKQMLTRQEIQDAKSMIALQWLFMR
jgi:ADP-ribose pyrophosphatase